VILKSTGVMLWKFFHTSLLEIFIFLTKNNLNTILDKGILYLDQYITKYINIYTCIKIVLIFLWISYLYTSFLAYTLAKLVISFLTFSVLIKSMKLLINNSRIFNNNSSLLNIIRYIMWSLLILNLFVLVYFSINLVFILFNLLIKDHILNISIKDLKAKWKAFSFKKDILKRGNKPPKTPQDSNLNFVEPNKKKDKKDDLIKRVEELKNQVLEAQEKNPADVQKPLKLNRNWDKKISVGKSEITPEALIKRIDEEVQKYTVQSEKFKDVIDNIDKNQENFYPSESKSLFKEYIILIDALKKDMKSVKDSINKDQTSK
jgi:hypothetical protein